MSRRDNGLQASAYTKLVDVESPVVDGLLEKLRDAEVAAYVAPAPGQRGPYGDTVLPRTPSDSVYVDSERREEARLVTEQYLAELAEELAWAGIVAGFDQPRDGLAPTWPAAEDVIPDADTDDEVEPRSGRVLRSAEVTVGFDELRRAAEGAAEIREDPEDHFEPPTPPPVPLPDTINRFAWAAVLGGPLYLVFAAVLDLDVSGWPGVLAVGAFVGGFVTLVARMHDRLPSDLDGDDGAVV
jgi:hypothetical protein